MVLVKYMKDLNTFGLWVLCTALLICNIVQAYRVDDLKYELKYSKTEVDQCYTDIDTTNLIIEEARSNAWTTYDEMGFTLENLKTTY